MLESHACHYDFTTEEPGPNKENVFHVHLVLDTSPAGWKETPTHSGQWRPPAKVTTLLPPSVLCVAVLMHL